jgi:hypothetical protein
MKIRIAGEGSAFGSRVTDNAGRVLDGVRSVTWRHEAGEPPRAEVELMFVPLDLIDEVEARMIGPAGKEVRRIEYADGSVDEYPAD